MLFLFEIELGIVEYRQIIKTIHDLHGLDFSDYALTSLKRRFEHIIQKHNLKNAEGLIARIKDKSGFFETILMEIYVESTEMFRDPTFWAFLRDEFFLSIFKNNNLNIKIWLPDTISGDELFSLMIVLKESNFDDRAEVYASSPIETIIEQIKTGFFQAHKFETSRDNYIRYKGEGDFGKYISIHKENYYRDISLIKNVKFLKQNINFDHQLQDMKLILYRNKMLYFNQNLHDKVMKKLSESIVQGGFLAIGNKEQLGLMIAKSFRLVNEAENVFKRL